MKRLQRPSAPARFDRTNADACVRLRQWYLESTRDHWNDEERGAQPVRDALRAMSADRCAWCEDALGGSLEVEHYLPKSRFPQLKYCWDNLLPACGTCNGAKLTWHPRALVEKKLIDPVLATVHEGECYDPRATLRLVDDRLIEPAVDDPAEHLTFQPEDCTWRPRSKIGTRTIERLFSDKSHNARMQRLSELAMGFARDRTSDETIGKYLSLHGRETTFRVLLDYWRGFFSPARASVATP